MLRLLSYSFCMPNADSADLVLTVILKRGSYLAGGTRYLAGGYYLAGTRVSDSLYSKHGQQHTLHDDVNVVMFCVSGDWKKLMVDGCAATTAVKMPFCIIPSTIDPLLGCEC